MKLFADRNHFNGQSAPFLTFSPSHFLAFSLLLITGCVTPPGPGLKPAAVPALRQVATENFPRFSDTAGKASFLLAAERSASYFDSFKGKKKFYRVTDRKVTPELLGRTVRELAKIMKEAADENELNRRIREKFDLFRSAGSDGEGRVVFSSYYEPVLDASLTRTPEYAYPIYARPKDLVTVNLENFDGTKWKGEKVNGRLKDGQIVPYFSREQIDFKKVFKGKGLELAWLKNRADIMDLHIEGSGKLRLPDGKIIKAGFAATNGLPFKGWMTVLTNSGVIPGNEITHEKAKKYLLEHQDAEPWILSTNRRYTFFQLTEMNDPLEGPTGTIGVPLVAGRSAAVDAQIFPLGALAYMEAPLPQVDDKGNVLGIAADSRFVLCQDTGGAILGPGRVDFFAGSGPKAKAFAFNLWESGKFYLLLLKFTDADSI
ncbi:MAG: MltA domain-containing protein [bacterium]